MKKKKTTTKTHVLFPRHRAISNSNSSNNYSGEEDQIKIGATHDDAPTQQFQQQRGPIITTIKHELF
jgi:hypothetical protein